MSSCILFPRHDRDSFAVHAPGPGDMVLEVIDNGDHPGLCVEWLDPDGIKLARDGELVLPVPATGTVIARLRSNYYDSDERASGRSIRFRIRHRKPDGSWSGEKLAAGIIVMKPWQKVVVPEDAPLPVIRIQAVQKGWFRLRVEGGGEIQQVFAGSSQIPGEAGVLLEPWQEKDIELLPVGNRPVRKGSLVIRLELQAISAADPPGLYPRIPPTDRFPPEGTH